MKARLENRVVVEILRAPAGFTVDQCFHPDLIASSVDLPIEVEQGWTIEEDGTIKDLEGVVVYTPPEPEPVVAPEEPTVVETPPVEVIADTTQEAPAQGV